MAEVVLVPLANGQWLALSREAFQEALQVGAGVMAPPSPVMTGGTTDERLVDAAELARVLSLPKSCIYEKARAGAIPCVRTGKSVRFLRSRVLAALGATGPVPSGRA
jgi:excisionase family DNA binding protein